MKEEEPPTVIEKAHGMNIWHVIEKIPRLGKLLKEAEESDSGLITKVVVDEFGVHLFGKVKSVVDVAAGSVMISRAVAQAFPEVKVTVLDLPHVIKVMDKSECRIQYVDGDMFEYIPPADALVLKNCHSLKNCHDSIFTHGMKRGHILICFFTFLPWAAAQGKPSLAMPLVIKQVHLLLIMANLHTKWHTILLGSLLNWEDSKKF
ncbi:tabersonine 16-O-methyltransferase-like [Asparagus officinalis]|uniref:tabersonine 16-O-methyltransferase-like n=1 Tax=Asparagus officinalis TaxID=4686 RepID=UPI00098E42C7|nr:tabersonine 16-O-methyltransferase-like [Asparagus officinalis]